MMLRMTGVALAALLVAAASAAIANPWKHNTGGALTEAAPPPPGSSHITFDIVVNRFGDKLRGSEGTSVFLADTGKFIAQFPLDVTNCTYVASLGRATTDGGVDERPGFISAQRSSGFDHGVFVETRGMGNKLRTRPFHLVVAC